MSTMWYVGSTLEYIGITLSYVGYVGSKVAPLEHVGSTFYSIAFASILLNIRSTCGYFGSSLEYIESTLKYIESSLGGFFIICCEYTGLCWEFFGIYCLCECRFDMRDVRQQCLSRAMLAVHALPTYHIAVSYTHLTLPTKRIV